MIESYGNGANQVTYILSSIKGIMMRMIFHNEKIELNKLPESVLNQEHLSCKFMPGKNELQG